MAQVPCKDVPGLPPALWDELQASAKTIKIEIDIKNHIRFIFLSCDLTSDISF
jgi:hypothetical protein